VHADDPFAHAVKSRRVWHLGTKSRRRLSRPSGATFSKGQLLMQQPPLDLHVGFCTSVSTGISVIPIASDGTTIAILRVDFLGYKTLNAINLSDCLMDNCIIHTLVLLVMGSRMAVGPLPPRRCCKIPVRVNILQRRLFRPSARPLSSCPTF
jgi:hypothetical protein